MLPNVGLILGQNIKVIPSPDKSAKRTVEHGRIEIAAGDLPRTLARA
jgi:hypothetical protein